LQCIKLLLKAKAQVNAKDQHGFTALMGASQSGHVEIMKILLNARADVNAREHEDGETAITMAMHCAQNEAVKCLIEFGATMPAGHERE
jgi:ankyrin repeat protein